MSSSDDPRKPKVEYLPPERARSYQPPSVDAGHLTARPLLRLPREPDVPSRGWFEDARLTRKRLRVQRHQELWDAFTSFLQTYRAYLGEEEKCKLAINRANRIEEILKDDDEEFKFEMEEKERARAHKRAQWAAMDAALPVSALDPSKRDDVVMQRHSQALRDMFMLPHKLRGRAEEIIKEIIEERGGEDKLTDKDRQHIADIREKTEEYIASIQERGE